MEEQNYEMNRPVNPRRKKRSQMQIFKEAYLPVIIAGLAVLLIIVFIIGSITRAVQKSRFEKMESIAASSSLAAEQERIDQAIQALIAEADVLAAGYDYEAAIALLNTFDSDIAQYPALIDQVVIYERAMKNMIAWEDPNQIPNLSFQILLADPSRGYSYQDYGSAINRNFVTTTEFSRILQQLYDNGYVLVDLDDFVDAQVGVDGTVTYAAKTLYLPNGKKPIMLTQTNVNYNYYLIDSNGDRIADAYGAGIASKLLWDGSVFTSEMVDATGNVITGDFDLVPILESFIAKNPSFSYKGARATLALTGYNGLLGYRTHPKAMTVFGEAAYQQDIQDVTTVINALRETGYTLACYTYENISYGSSSLSQINTDMNEWTNEVTPILGNINILTYAQMSDIATPQTAYSGEKYEVLRDLGFRYFIGFCEDGKPWTSITSDYVRQGRIMVSGSTLAYHADWFAAMFDASTVLDATRVNIPR